MKFFITSNFFKVKISLPQNLSPLKISLTQEFQAVVIITKRERQREREGKREKESQEINFFLTENSIIGMCNKTKVRILEEKRKKKGAKEREETKKKKKKKEKEEKERKGLSEETRRKDYLKNLHPHPFRRYQFVERG